MGKHRNSDQEQIFAKHIKNAPQILRGDWRADLGWEEMHKLWAQLTADLNKHGPPTKDITGWRRILKDWKSAVLRKVSLRYPLTDVETLIAQKCGYMNDIENNVFNDGKEAECFEEEAQHLDESLQLDEVEQYDSDEAVSALNKKRKNTNQELVFLKFIEKHNEMRTDCWKSDPDKWQELWHQLALELNRSGPPKKDINNWKRILKEWKYSVQKKLDPRSTTPVPLTANDKVLARLFKFTREDVTVENENSVAEEMETEKMALEDNDRFYEGEDEDDCMLSSTLKKQPNVNTAQNDTDLVNLSSWEPINSDQEQVVLKFLDKYPEMRVKNGEKYPAKWEILVSKLNECGPPVKNIRSWKKIILDWKCNVQKMLIPSEKFQKHLSANDKILATLCGLQTSKVEMDDDSFNGFEFNTTTDFNIKCESEAMNVTDTTMSQSERKHKNTEQEKYIIKYIEKNPQIVNMKGLCKAERDAIWLELVDKLNCMGPPRKDLTSWKKVFFDWRQSLKKKLRRDGKDALFGNEDQFARLNGLYDQFDDFNSSKIFSKNLDETTILTQSVVATMEEQSINRSQKKSNRLKSECRTCRINSSMLHKLSEGIPSYPNKTLNDLLTELVQQTNVTEASMLPQQLCYICTSKLLNAYDFMVQVRETQAQLLDELKNADEPFITSTSADDCLSENPLKLIEETAPFEMEDVEDMLPKAKVNTKKMFDTTNTEYEDPLEKSFSQDDEVEEEEAKEAEENMEIDKATNESQLSHETKTPTVAVKKSERLRIKSAFSLNKSVLQKPSNEPTNSVTNDTKKSAVKSEGLKHKNASQINRKINQHLKELLESDDDVPISSIKKRKMESTDSLNKPYLQDEAVEINEVTKLEIFDEENEPHENEDESLHYKDDDDEAAKDFELESVSINSDNDEQSCSNRTLNAPIRRKPQKADEKFFKCKKCPAQFYWPHNLQYHMRKHQNTESWNSCPYCNRKFYRMDMLKRHIKTHGVNVSPIYSKPAKCQKPKATDVDPNVCVPNGPKQILCMICQRMFNSFAELRTHLLEHPDIDFEQCSELVDTLYGYNSNISKEEFEQRLQTDLSMKKLAPYYIIINQAGYELTLDSSETEFEDETQDDNNDEDAADVEPSSVKRQRTIKLNSYTCELCKSEFSRKYLLYDHQRRDHEWLDAQHVCSRCDGRFLSKQILDMHQRKNCKNPSKRFMCTRCPVRFFWRRNLKSHVITHRTTEPFKCSKCERTFAAKHALTKHLYNDHPADKELICCSWCPRKFYRREVFLEHSKRRHGIDELRLPLAETLAQATMDPNGTKDIVCKVCNEKFERISELREHFLLEMTTHQDYSSFSSYSITNQAGYELHIDDSDTDDENNEPDSEIYVKPKRKKNVIVKNMPYSCDLCKIQCMRKYQMMRHQRDLHKFAPSLPHNCDKCVFKTVCKEIFQNHQLYQCDNAEKQNVCQICGYKFMWTENLERHLSLQHPEPTLTLKEAAAQKALSFENVNKLKCPHCDKTYRLATCLNNHIRDIHINQKKKYLCITCGWATENRSKLTIHTRYHTGERPYLCHLCDKTYITRFQLTRHIARHDENRDWRCDVCNRVFHTPINLKRHLKTHVTND